MILNGNSVCVWCVQCLYVFVCVCVWRVFVYEYVYAQARSVYYSERSSVSVCVGGCLARIMRPCRL